MKEGKKNRTGSIHVTSMKWVYLLSLLIVVGGVMSFGLIGSLFLQLDDRSALTMLGMIPLMTAFVMFGMHLVVKGMEKRTTKLIDAIHEVAGGDLSVQIEEKDAQEYEQVYREFNAMVRELSRTRAEMEGFVNEFAHEFKTPITSISGFAEYLYETGAAIETEERMEYLKVMDDQAKRLVRLSQNTLLLSKMEAMQIVTDQETYDLGEQIRRCAIMLLPQIEEKQLELELPEQFDLPFTGNREMLEHVWINLLGNAVKFTPAHGRISISGETVSNVVRIRIQDTGIGMTEEVKAHIFEKYYQNDSVSLTKGNGIGLSIVKRIVELHNGSIQVKSVPKTGSIFEITFALS